MKIFDFEKDGAAYKMKLNEIGRASCRERV